MAIGAIQINEEMTVDEVIRRYPKTKQVFVRFGVDTCCGGYRKIKDGAKVSGADISRLLTQLREAAE